MEVSPCVCVCLSGASWCKACIYIFEAMDSVLLIGLRDFHMFAVLRQLVPRLSHFFFNCLCIQKNISNQQFS